MSAKKILFVTYNAPRSGASVLLLNLARALQEAAGCKTDFAFRSGGDMLDDFKTAGNVTCINTGHESITAKLVNRFVDKTGAVFKKLLSQPYDAVVLNTVLNADLAPLIRKYYTGKLVCYVHEMKAVIQALTGKELLKNVQGLIDAFIVPAHCMKDDLIKELGIVAEKIHILPSYIPVCTSGKATQEKKGKFIVGGCGTVEMRKGTDLFIELAQFFTKHYPDASVEFFWTGGNPHSIDFILLEQDIQKLNLSNTRLQPTMKDTADFYNSLDVFVLPSREDPYPLVVLEAANAAVPSVCFEEAGGAAAFIEGNGVIVPYLNIEQMAGAVHAYYTNPGKLKTDGEKAKAKLVQLHQNKTAIVNRFLEILQ